MPDYKPSQRALRVAEIIRHELARILTREDLDEPDLHGVSITVAEVRMSSDLKTARCYCSRLGAGDARIAAPLNTMATYLRGRLGREIALKFTPRLVFVDDGTQEYAARIDALLAGDTRMSPDEPSA